MVHVLWLVKIRIVKYTSNETEEKFSNKHNPPKMKILRKDEFIYISSEF